MVERAAKKRTAKTAGRTAKPKVSKADKELQKAAIENLKNTREYPELIGLLGVAPYKTVATVNWLNKRLPSGEPRIEKVLKKEKERFALVLVKSGTARTVIDELRDEPSKQWKTLFAELAGMGIKKAEARVLELTPKNFVLFCEVNTISVVHSGPKQSPNKKKTLPNVLAKLKEMQEYLKL